MQRGYWVFLVAFSLVVALLAFVVFSIFDEGGQDQDLIRVQQVKTYSVPLERAESIRDALSTVLLATREGAQPLGQASLPMPGVLLVAAPATMQPSIETAIRQLSEGADSIDEAALSRSFAFDILVFEAAPEAQADDAELQTLQPVLDQAREIFGLDKLRVVNRITLVGSNNASSTDRWLYAATNSLGAEINSLLVTADGVNVGLALSWPESRTHFSSTLTLRNDQWQAIGVLGRDGADTPERLLLVRQRPVDATP